MSRAEGSIVTVSLSPLLFSTLAHLMRHLHLLAQSASVTGMTSRNLALVWAPNLLRSEQPQHSLVSEENLRDIGVQARCVEFLISQYEELFLTPRDFPLASGNLAHSSSAVDFDLSPPRHASTPFKSSASVEFNLNGPPEPYQRSFYGSFNNLRLSARLPPSRYQDERSLRSLQPEMIKSSCVKSSSGGAQARVNIPSRQESHHEVKHLPKVCCHNQRRGLSLTGDIFKQVLKREVSSEDYHVPVSL